jgi:uncharacterized protein
MKKAIWIAPVVGIGLAMVSWTAFAQAPAGRPANTITAAAIPVDQQPTEAQLAKLFELIRVRDQIASVAKMLPAMMQQQMAAQMKQMQQDHPEMQAMTEEQKQAFTKVLSKLMGRVVDLFTPEEMIADMTGLYQKHMTRSDIDGIIVFYSSPAGQHLLDMQPVILQEYMPLVMQRVQDRIKPLTDEITKELTEITKSMAPPADKPTQK